MKGLSIESIENTCEDVVITYTPLQDVTSYSYVIIKNNIYGDKVSVSSSSPVNIVLNETGIYKIEITTYNSYNLEETFISGEYKIDKEAPIINIKEKTYKITSSSQFSVMDGVSASDAFDGDLTQAITTNINDINFNQEGIKEIKYSVSDSAGNVSTETVYVTVKMDNTNLIRMGQIGILLVVVAIIVFLLKYIRSIKLEKRFSKFTINSSKNTSISLFDNLYNQYINFIDKLSTLLSKSVFLTNRSKRYSKYNMDDKENIKFMSRKIVIGIIFIVVAIIVKLIQSMILKPYEMIIPFIIGFYTLDIIYLYKYAIYRKKIENDLLEAITIMNNSFKAGRSIVQAIDVVAIELKGPIASEFKKISLELSYGLDIEVAFKRFADRIKLDDAIYLTSSLSVLNKTGGNIIKVFDSIEKNMFNRKKLEDELKSLTSSSKLIMYVLIFVPIAFILFIALINKGYFEPLLSNPLGLILIAIMIVIYITYIIVVKRVMRVRM